MSLACSQCIFVSRDHPVRSARRGFLGWPRDLWREGRNTDHILKQSHSFVQKATVSEI